MRGLVGDDFIPRSTVHQDGDLIAHGPRRHKHRRLLADHLRDHLAQAVGAGVLIALLVAHLRIRHRLTHSGAGASLGVTVQINIDGGHIANPVSSIKGRSGCYNNQAVTGEYSRVSSTGFQVSCSAVVQRRDRYAVACFEALLCRR